MTVDDAPTMTETMDVTSAPRLKTATTGLRIAVTAGSATIPRSILVVVIPSWYPVRKITSCCVIDQARSSPGWPVNSS
jgi:hypothetical protein